MSVYSFVLAGPTLTETSIVLPITQSVCNMWLNGFGNTNPGSWIVCPFGAAGILLTGEVEIITIVAMLLFIIPIVVLGNAFCSWACPIGTVIDSFDKSVEKFLPKIEAKREKRALQRRKNKRNKQEKNLVCPSCPVSKVTPERYGVLANGVLASAFVGAAVFRLPVFCVVCPIGIATRGMIHLRSLQSIAGRFLPFILELLPIPIIAVLVSLRERRFWCKKLCPVGSLLRATGKLSPFLKLRVEDKKCVMKGCPEDCEDYRLDMCFFCRTMDDRSCEKVCPVDINLVDHGSFDRCTKCLECYVVCDHDAVKINIFEKPKISGIGGLFGRIRRRKRKSKVALVENLSDAVG
ncbi:MAG: 4Fe-4S binding protein [Candidatus Bathyarchaeota archaeon]|nr:MAG: 4Fe-4S binding protein [Candidatus Bathyarchaeota archaeon]